MGSEILSSGILLKGLLSSVLSLQLISPSPAPSIELHRVYSPEYSYTVTDSLPWSASLRQGAEQRIQAQVKKLEDVLQGLRDQGATRLITRPIKDSINVNERRALNGVARINLLGYAGKTLVNPGGTEYQDFMRYGDYLIRPATTSCSLEAWNLLVPFTWFEDRCTIERPTVEHYLNYSLRAFINYANPRDLVFYLENVLKGMVKVRRPFTVAGGEIKADFTGIAQDLKSIPLQNSSPLGGYKITVNSAKSKIVFTELPPNLIKLASKGKYFPKDKMLAFDVG